MKTTTMKKSAMLVGDSFFIPVGFAEILQKHGYNLISIGSEGSEIIAGTRLDPQIIIVDFSMRRNDPLLATAILHKALPSSSIAVMNGPILQCNETAARSAGATKILNRNYHVADFEAVLQDFEQTEHP